MQAPRPPMHKIQAVVLQPTTQCNINCHYCYLPGRLQKREMTSAVLTRIIEALFASSLLAEHITLIWHAGEPLLVPLDFYEETMTLLQRFNTRGVAITPSVQTNGTRITQQWCDFIKRQHVRVGVSLDGPEHIHNHSRVNRGGQGTFASTMRGVQLLQEHGIQPAIFSVLTRYALGFPDEIWHFFHDHRLTNLSFNIEEVNGVHTRSSLEEDEQIKDKYKQFLRRMLELNECCEQPPFIREIDTFRGRIHTLEASVSSQENIPGTLVSFDYAGNVSTFASELLTMKHPRYGDFLLGNILDSTLDDALGSQKLLAINAEIQRGVQRCQQTCAYFSFCGGGSPANKFSELGTLDATETLYCRLKIQATLDVMLEHEEASYPI